jgi:hypothetical protein
MDAIEFQAVVKDGAIEIPPEHRQQLSGSVLVTVVPEANDAPREDFIDYLLDHPRRIPGFAPLTRDEAHGR